MADEKRPEWVPEGEHDSFTTTVMKGTVQPPPPQRAFRKKTLTLDELESGVRANNRTVLGQAITLIESSALKHQEKAQALLQRLLPYTGASIRIGITGVPGAGKSTFIEAFGTMLCQNGHRVAVLAVDPSSSLTGGSILGDKTRMEQLILQQNAFVRPSPSGGALGGVNRRTRETMLLCEAAGYDVILVETVGVGQSEGMVRDMVDFFLLLSLTGAGDELQGMKRGILELTDGILINKADGENKLRALQTASLYSQMTHLFQRVTAGWDVHVGTCSVLYKEGLAEFWAVIEQFTAMTKASGSFSKRRSAQKKDWLYASIREQLEQRFFADERMKGVLPQVERDIADERQSVTGAVLQLMKQYEAGRNS